MFLRHVWSWIWSWAGAVPVRWKVIGIVVTSQLVVGLSIAWWVRTSLGQWLSYLLSEDKVVLAMDAGMCGVIAVAFLLLAVQNYFALLDELQPKMASFALIAFGLSGIIAAALAIALPMVFGRKSGSTATAPKVKPA